MAASSMWRTREDGVEAKTRPVTFFYNGGPGAATIWLHMGSLGPVRVITQSPEATAPAPFEWVPNQYSLLDKSDLVFIDAPLWGFSRAVGKGTAKDFAGTDQDIKAFEQVYRAIHYGEPAVELAEVFIWGVVWDDAVGRAGGGAAERWD